MLNRVKKFSAILVNFRIFDSALPSLERKVAYKWVIVGFKVLKDF
jgi:hypothetical protein